MLLVGRLGDPEVGDLGGAVLGQKQVFGLDVAVDHAFPVGVTQGLDRLAGDPQRLFDRQHALAAKALPQALAPDVGHGEPEAAGALAGVIDREDVRVVETGGEADLTLEPLGAERGPEIGIEHLQRDEPVVLQVAGEIHGGHAATAEHALQEISVAERFGEQIGGVGHARFGLGNGRNLPCPAAGRQPPTASPR